MTLLIELSGPPASGKSHWANIIKELARLMGKPVRLHDEERLISVTTPTTVGSLGENTWIVIKCKQTSNLPDFNDEPGCGNVRHKSDPGVLAEYNHWNKIIKATAWGSHLAAAQEFRVEAELELKRRGLEVPHG